MKKIFVFIIILTGLSSLRLFAETVSASTAELVARRFVSGIGMTKSNASDVKLVWNGTDTKSSDAPFYVFSTGEKGFVIVAGNDGMQPVLGYSTEGSFDKSDIPGGMAMMLEAYRRNAIALAGGKAKAAEGAAIKWSELLSGTKAGSSPTAVVALNTANWGQDEPFNLNTPVVGSKHCPTGCAPTALSVLMKFYKWPDKGYGTLEAYTTDSLKIQIPARTLGYNYDWTNMFDDYSGKELTQTQKDAVSRLLADVGQMLHADYKAGSTGAYIDNVPGYMSNHMKYSNKAIFMSKSSYSYSQWSAMIKADLDAGHPVLYAGDDVAHSSGHAFLVDGYDTDGRFHFNWGWDGSDNAYLFIADTEFSYNEEAVFGLVPDKSEGWTPKGVSTLSYVLSYSHNAFNIWSNIPYVEQGGKITISAAIQNKGNSDYSGKFRFVQRRPSATDVILFESSNAISLGSGYSTILSIPNITIANISDGDDIVMCYEYGGEWLTVNEGKISIPLRYSLPKVLSLMYSKGTDGKPVLQINGMVGMTVKIGDQEATTMTAPAVEIENLYGTAVYTIGNGHESYSVTLKFPDSSE